MPSRVLLVAALLMGTSPAFAQGPSNYSIRGVVVSATTGIPLEGAVVTMSSTEGRVMISEVTTGEDGSFEFDHLRAASYTLRASRRGYNAAFYDEHERFFSGVVTGPGQDTSRLRFRLQPGAMISGVVTDDAGDPVRNAQVVLYRKEANEGLGKITQSGSQQTNDLGAFEFAGLAADDYFVSVTATPWYAVQPQPRYDAHGNFLPAAEGAPSPLDVAYPLTFYVDATDSDDATPIPLRAGDHVQLNLSLHAVPALHLRIRRPDGEKQNGRMVQITQMVFDHQVQSSYVNSFYGNGSVEISGVAPGHYQLRYGEGQASNLDLTADTTLDSGPPNPGVEIRGRVAMADGESLPPYLYLSLNSVAGNISPGAAVGKDGAFTLEGIAAGSYELNLVGAETAFSVTGMAADAATTEGRLLKLGSNSTNLAIVATRDSATVKGFAVQKNGKPAPGVMIVLVPRDPGANRELFRRDESNTDGSFLLSLVAPGAYTLIAIDDGWSLDWARPEVIEHYLARGEKIDIAPSQPKVGLPEPIEVQPR